MATQPTPVPTKAHAKTSPKAKTQAEKKPKVSDEYLRALRLLSGVPMAKHHAAQVVSEVPFELQLLSLSAVYRRSRKLYVDLGGTFVARMGSTMRSLSAYDLFKDEIQYSPVFTEMQWFGAHPEDVIDPEEQVAALTRFTDCVFHEQNHRVIWRLMPPPPKSEDEMRRYLNFAEGLVVMLDLVLGDQIGRKLSPVYEHVKVIFRGSGTDGWNEKSNESYRRYLLAAFYATYCMLELVHDDDVLKAADYVFPSQKNMNRDAVDRAFGLSDQFTRITNPQWQDRHWESSRKKLEKIHAGSVMPALRVAKDPVDFDEPELRIARMVLDVFGV